MRAAALLFAASLSLATQAQAQGWADFATVSMTNPTTPKLTSQNLCYTDGIDMACDGAAGMFTTSGTLAITNVSATGNVSAVKFIGDGSLLTGISGGSGSASDHITSGTATMSVGENGYVSLTTSGVDWGYLGSSGSYLPTLNVATFGANTLYAAQSTTVSGTLSLINGTSGSGYMGVLADSNAMVFSNNLATPIYIGVSNTANITVDPSGSVGIGTTAPAATLDVSGTVHASGNVTVNGTVGMGYERKGATGNYSTATVVCSAGKKILGGGCFLNGGYPQICNDGAGGYYALQSYPSNTDRWTCACQYGNTNGTISAYAICARMN